MESTLLKVGKNEWFVTIGFLTTYSNFKILYATAAMIWKFCLYISDIDIMTVKNIDCGCIIHDINKSVEIDLSENFMVEDRDYI